MKGAKFQKKTRRKRSGESLSFLLSSCGKIPLIPTLWSHKKTWKSLLADAGRAAVGGSDFLGWEGLKKRSALELFLKVSGVGKGKTWSWELFLLDAARELLVTPWNYVSWFFWVFFGNGHTKGFPFIQAAWIHKGAPFIRNSIQIPSGFSLNPSLRRESPT